MICWFHTYQNLLKCLYRAGNSIKNNRGTSFYEVCTLKWLFLCILSILLILHEIHIQILIIWPLWIWAPLMIIPPPLNKKLAFWVWGGGYYFIYLFIYSYKYYILLYIFYITTSYIRLQLIYIQFEKKIHTVEPPFNKPLYNKVLSITNYFLQPSQKLQENVWNRTLL